MRDDDTREDLKVGVQVGAWCVGLLVVLFLAYQPPAAVAEPRFSPGAFASCSAGSAGWACRTS